MVLITPLSSDDALNWFYNFRPLAGIMVLIDVA